MNEEYIKLLYELWVLLSETVDVVQKVRRKELQKYDISVEHARVLCAIEVIGDEATPTKISQLMLRELNSVSEIIGRMEKVGFTYT